MPITFSPEAIDKVKLLRSRETDAEASLLRVFVAPGGCHGLSYGLSFETKPREGDVRFEVESVPVVMDALSHYMMRSCIVDYHDTLMQSGFEIANPAAKSTCACGTSFSSEELPGKAEKC